MKFSFSDFQFDCEKLILTRQDRVISLNEKPAQLLAMFLCDTDAIHNKADILEKIWPDRIVTEQVVFQNISHLRALFGDDAIKTFAKKGYQWQLPLTEVSEKQEETPLVENEKSITKKNRLAFGKRVTIFALVLSVVFVLYQYLPNNLQNPASAKPSVTLLSLTQSTDDKSFNEVSALLTSSNNIKLFSKNKTSQQLSGQALFNSPFRTWKTYSTSEHQLFLSYKLYPLDGKAKGETALRFYLQGKYRGWQGYIVGKTHTSLTTQLTQLLDSVQPTAYFSLKSSTAALAELTLLLNKQPNNLLLKQQLIQIHYELGNYDLASALVDNELTRQQHILNIGILHLLKVDISARNSNWQTAEKHIGRALSTISELNFPQLESNVLIQAAWVSFVNRDYRQTIRYLNAAANKARVAGEPLQEVKAHLTQSFMASKTKQTALMHSHLDLAKQLIEVHQLNDEHQVSVLSYMSWSSKIVSEELTYNLEILATPFSEQYKYNFYLAADFVRQELIKQKRFEEALKSIKPWQRLSFATLTRAQVAFAQEQWLSASKLAVEAFTAARIDHENYDALDAALLLVRLKKELPESFKISEYIDYISHKPNKRWSRINKELTDELGYW